MELKQTPSIIPVSRQAGSLTSTSSAQAREEKDTVYPLEGIIGVFFVR
jgi:hypothetical protein